MLENKKTLQRNATEHRTKLLFEMKEYSKIVIFHKQNVVLRKYIIILSEFLLTRYWFNYNNRRPNEYINLWRGERVD